MPYNNIYLKYYLKVSAYQQDIIMFDNYIGLQQAWSAQRAIHEL